MKLRGVRKLSRPFDYNSDDFATAWREMESAVPRAAAIVAGAFIEDALRWSLEGYFIPGLECNDLDQIFTAEGAPLASFHAKIVIGYSVGLYGQVAYSDLRSIKRIRNAFAHAPRAITFETSEILDECKRLSYLNAAKGRAERKIMPLQSLPVGSPKELFFATVKILYLDLHVMGSEHAEKLGGMP